jgi:hypothetical protein
MQVADIDLGNDCEASEVICVGARYFLSCYDDYSRKVHLTFLKQKSDAFIAIKDYFKQIWWSNK